MSVVVVATITPRPGEEDSVREAILAAAAKVHSEPGCELYAAHEADGAFVMVEKWGSPEALATHGSADALRELGAALKGRVAAPPDVRRLTPLPAGEPGKGAV